VVSSRDELQASLLRLMAGDRTGMFTGEVKREKVQVASEGDSVALEPEVEMVVAAGDFSKLAELWCGGAVIDWRRLSGSGGTGVVSLPGYPFARERYWVDGPGGERSEESVRRKKDRFVITKDKPVLRDHRVE